MSSTEESSSGWGERVYPKALRERPRWLLWMVDKPPRAPWMTSDMNLCRWTSELEKSERPEVSFETAVRWAQHDGLEHLPGCPDGSSSADIEVGYLLPHENPPSRPAVVFVDFDNVRNPDTGEVHPVAEDLVGKLDSFTELSQSGTGLHVFVFGRLPDQRGSFAAPIAEDAFVPSSEKLPSIEMYQERKWAAMTGQHVPETPTDVRLVDDVLGEIVSEFCRDTPEKERVHTINSDWNNNDSKKGGTRSSQSPYYDYSVRAVTEASGTDLYQAGEELRCNHPAHGGTNGNNFAIAPNDQVWRCYRAGHEGAGGNALHLVAMIEGYLDCQDCTVSGALDRLDDEEFARLCLDARDTYGFTGTPPYRAVVGVARYFELLPDGQDILGDSYQIALTLYENTIASELTS